MHRILHRRLTTTRLNALITSGSLRADPAQITAAFAFDAALTRIAAFVKARALATAQLLASDALIAEKEAIQTPPQFLLIPRDVARVGALPRGLYVYGPVGSGKSLLADLFCDDAAAAHGLRVKRQHFHAFLLGVHERVRAIKSAIPSRVGGHIDRSPERDAFSRVGAELAASADVFVLDELQVTDVADALILARVFRSLLAAGAALVVTSNRPAIDLYAGGLNREYFLPTITALETHCVALNMAQVACDYRVDKAKPRAGRYSVGPLATATDQLMVALNAFVHDTYSGGGISVLNNTSTIVSLPLAFGRTLNIQSPSPGIALCNFQDLCARPLGASDYGALARSCHIVALYGVPNFTRATHNEARRFITLIDELYEARCILFIQAQTFPQNLFTKLTLARIPLTPSAKAWDGMPPSPPRSGPFLNEPLSTAEISALHVANTPLLLPPPAAAIPASDYDAVDDTIDSNDNNNKNTNTNNKKDGDSNIPRIMTVVSAAEVAALEELKFACSRAVSRLIEMTSEGFESQTTEAVRQRNKGTNR